MESFSDISAGHLMVRQLEEQGVERVYCVPGESYLDVLDGLYDSKIRTVVCRQEGGAGMMAMSEARLTGRAGVAMVTRGPGAANAMIALHNAWQDGTPLVLFVGLIDSRERGREAFQDFSLEGWFGSTAKWVVTLDNPREAARVVAHAFAVAESGKPGPVVIGVPEDILRHRVEASTEVPVASQRVMPLESDLDEVIDQLQAANAPTIIIGGEVWSAEAAAAVARIGEQLQVPIAADFRAADLVDNASEAYVGMLGYGRDPGLAAFVGESDLLLFLGCGRTDVLSEGYTIGNDATTIISSTDAEHQGHYGRVDRSFTLSPANFVVALSERLATRGAEAAHDSAARAERLGRARRAFEAFSTPTADGAERADLGVVMQAIAELREPDAIVTYGAGNYAVWPQRYLTSHVYPSLVAPKNGAMGLSVPSGVAAALVSPERQVLTFAGDGCFLMNGQEIATAVAEGTNVTFFVFDNGIYGTIRVHQEREYPGRVSGTRLQNPDFAQFAESFGATGFTIEQPEQAREVVQRALATEGVKLVHVFSDPEVRSPKPEVAWA
ncbi:thiamine pyrophosphate-dependent enzyme [Leucobacter sp. USHLN153]|uniref:thiamine pyrophosphate-dependent enzyme n=1 Tax=Leucobacter sp. USHLN153 TaxID=3081268 RepID=UPI0030185473